MLTTDVTNRFTLDQFIELLATRAEVNGLIIMGSAASGAPTSIAW